MPVKLASGILQVASSSDRQRNNDVKNQTVVGGEATTTMVVTQGVMQDDPKIAAVGDSQVTSGVASTVMTSMTPSVVTAAGTSRFGVRGDGTQTSVNAAPTVKVDVATIMSTSQGKNVDIPREESE